MNAMNNIFRDENNVVYAKVSVDKVNNEGNFITVVKENGKDVAAAFVKGQRVPFPAKLMNEIGVVYHFVDFYQHGLKMAKKHGVYRAAKQEAIRVWRNVMPGEPVKTVIDGYEEHSVELPEGSFAAQNVVKNEFYAIPGEVLAEKYEFVRSEFDYDLYQPKAGVTSEWVYSDVNVVGVLWGGLEFLTTPMINITNPEDCYGCNYIVFWGNDGRMASYKVVGYFCADKVKYYALDPMVAVGVADAEFNPPKALFAEMA